MDKVGKVIIFFAVLIFALWGLNKAFGAILIDNTTYPAGIDWGNAGVGRVYCDGNTYAGAQSFVLDNSASISSVVVKMSREGSPTNQVYANIKTSTGVGGIIATSTAIEGTSISGGYPASSTVTFAFSPSVALSSGTTYYFEILPSSQNNSNWYGMYRPNSPSQSSYASGTEYSIYHTGGTCTLNSTWNNVSRDLWFQVLGDVDNITITSPTDSATTTDFGFWNLDYGFADGIPIGGGTPDTGYITVRYGLSSSTPEFSDTQNVFAWSDASAIIPKSAILNFPTTYYAQATLYTSSSVAVATSTMISFDIQSEGGDFGSADSTSTVSEAIITCDPNSGFFANSFCKVLVFLFIPSQNVINDYSDLADILKDKPPLGYFGAIKTAWEGIALSTSTVDIPDLTALDTGFFSPVKTAFATMLWISFGFWIFHRFRKIQI